MWWGGVSALNKMMGNRKPCNLYKTFRVQSAIPSVWKVQFQQFERFSLANIELFHVVCSTRNFVLLKIGHFMDINHAKNGGTWVEHFLGAKCTMWKSSLLATEKCLNYWNWTLQTEVIGNSETACLIIIFADFTFQWLCASSSVGRTHSL